MSVIMSKIRSSAEVWLIGKSTEKLPGSHLPTNADILQCLMFFHVQGKSPLKEAAALTVSKVSKACLSKLNNWGLQNRVCGIVFYTTASNTSLKNGACTLIENSLQQELAWVTCHHHVMELPLAAVFSISFGPTGGPHVVVFRRFQQTWPSLYQTTHEMTPTDMFDSHTSALREQIVQFGKAAHGRSYQRDDYTELLQLSFDLSWF